MAATSTEQIMPSTKDLEDAPSLRPEIIDNYNDNEIDGIAFCNYRDESQLDTVMSLVGRDLSEPYSIFTYRYFLYRFPQLCILAVDKSTNEPIGCVVGKMDTENNDEKSGYLGMLAVDQKQRRKGIGRALVKRVLFRMRDQGCSSVTLETEVSNKAAQRLYQEAFGFVREELLVRYYLNWGDAYRLRLWFHDDVANAVQDSD